jgi:subtilisin
MSDDSLAKRIAAVGGRVMIGFREPNAPLALTEAARTPVSRATRDAATAWLRSKDIAILHEYKIIPAVSATIDPSLVSTLRANPRIEYVEPDEPIHPASQDTNWSVDTVHAPAAWPSSTGSGIKVLVVGTGAQTNSDLSWTAIDGCGGSSGVDTVTTGPYAGHETAVAGVIAALDNSSGTIGIAPGVSLYSVHTPHNSDVACAMQYAEDNHIFAVNMSFEGTPFSGESDAIAAAADSGILLVGSAGNHDSSSVAYPASLPDVIAVGATDAFNNRASFSNYGTGLELVAPGTYIMTTCPGNTICQLNGTSFSAPAVTAAAAILKAYHPAWSSTDIRARLDSSAEDIGSAADFGFGLLDVYGALTYTYPVVPTISIDGPTRIRPGATCTWTADASGGVTPYTYDWHMGSTDVGSDEELYASKPVGLGSTFWLFLDVRTADHAHASTKVSVTESSTAPICPY